MATSAKQNQTEPARSNGKCRAAKPGDAGGKTAVSQPSVYATDEDGTLVDWSGEQHVRSKVGEWTMTEEWREDQVKLSRLGRQRVDLTALIAMSSGYDLSQLSDSELKGIELGSPEQLNELARRICKLKSQLDDSP